MSAARGNFDLDMVEAAEVARDDGSATVAHLQLLDAYKGYLRLIDRAHNVRVARGNPGCPLSIGILRHYGEPSRNRSRGHARRQGCNTRTRGSRRGATSASASRDGPSDEPPGDLEPAARRCCCRRPVQWHHHSSEAIECVRCRGMVQNATSSEQLCFGGIT
jgi:hypothetical protein